MITRARPLWILFVLGLLLVFGALYFVGRTAIRADRQIRIDQATRLRDEKLHVALWRMDAAMQTLITRESVRPHASYRAFRPLETAIDRNLNASVPAGWLVPSPLLTERPSHVRLHFLFGTEGSVSSPQNPVGPFNAIAVQNFVPSSEVDNADSLLGAFANRVDGRTLLARLPAPSESALDPRVSNLGDELTAYIEETERSRDQAASQQKRNRAELARRQQQLEFAANQASYRNDNGFSPPPGLSNTARHLSALEGPMHALWIDDVLLLSRRVRVGDETLVEGCWLDWDTLKEWLLSQVADLAPGADLVPDAAEEKDGTRHLASLPARLVPPEIVVAAPRERSPVENAVALAWVVVAVAAVVVGLVLRQAISLMERRGTFVSAVTHEMRTPLTTFRLYTDLLASGAARDPEKATRYVDTLRAEASRLTHLVENVLGFARLERGRSSRESEVQDVGELLQGVRERLGTRAQHGERSLRWETPDGPARVRADQTTVEQILANLVDNACKHGAPHDDPTITVRVGAVDGRVTIDVEDHGPGVPVAARRRLFRAFAKSATEAAHTAPGIGLGLAYSRRLARRLGGDLSHVPTDSGCVFRLVLPRVADSEAG